MRRLHTSTALLATPKFEHEFTYVNHVKNDSPVEIINLEPF